MSTPLVRRIDFAYPQNDAEAAFSRIWPGDGIPLDEPERPSPVRIVYFKVDWVDPEYRRHLLATDNAANTCGGMP